MTTEIGTDPRDLSEPYRSETPVKLTINGGTILTVYAYSAMGKTPVDTELNQIYGNIDVEINDGKVYTLAASYPYSRTWGDSNIIIRGRAASDRSFPTIVGNALYKSREEADDYVDGDINVIFDDCGENNNSISSSKYISYGKQIRFVDNVFIKNGSCVYFEGDNRFDDVGTLTLEDDTILALKNPITVSDKLEFEEGATLALSRPDGDNVDQISGPAAITVDGEIAGKANIYTVMPVDDISGGLEISRPLDGEVYLKAESMTEAEAGSGEKSQLYTLGNGNAYTYIEYVSGSEISDTYDHIWRIKTEELPAVSLKPYDTTVYVG